MASIVSQYLVRRLERIEKVNETLMKRLNESEERANRLTRPIEAEMRRIGRRVMFDACVIEPKSFKAPDDEGEALYEFARAAVLPSALPESVSLDAFVAEYEEELTEMMQEMDR